MPRIGIGGWTYEPWRGEFYPQDLPHARELSHASRALNSIEINGTYYGAQKPESFARWHDETPEDFIFSVKAPRFATNRKVLAEAGSSIERFFTGGLMRLGRKLGPVNWQFMPHKHFDSADFTAFLALLPKQIDGIAIQHVVEVRHDSFRTPEFVALARAHQIGIVIAADSPYPQIADLTAPFVYARIMGTKEQSPDGYAPAALDHWADRIRQWQAGDTPDDLPQLANKLPQQPRQVFVYVISGCKKRNPAAAMALAERVRA